MAAIQRHHSSRRRETRAEHGQAKGKGAVLSECVPYVFRSDRAAAQFVGIKSVWRFHLWAIGHGLKASIKANPQSRTIYKSADLKAACEADLEKQQSI